MFLRLFWKTCCHCHFQIARFEHREIKKRSNKCLKLAVATNRTVAVLFVSMLQNTVRKASKFLSQPLVDIMRSAEPEQVYSEHTNDVTN